MNKSLIFLAVLAASGAALAQSSVTLYGVGDIYYASVKSKTSSGVDTDQTVLDSGNLNGVRWGIRGAEDLGGGLKASFTFESGFDLSTGAQQQGVLMGRQAFVGFDGGFGSVKFGRTYSAYDDASGAANPVFNSALSPMTTLGLPVYRSIAHTVRTNNTVRYDSPDIGGFSGAINYALGEETASATHMVGVKLQYAKGPLFVGLGLANETTNVAGMSNKEFARLNASYEFGALKVMGNLGKAGNINNVTGADASEFTLGADYNVSSAVVLSAGYSESKDNATQSALTVGGTGDVKRTGYGLGARYFLSKTTNFYGGYVSTKQTKSGLGDATRGMLAVGMQKWF